MLILWEEEEEEEDNHCLEKAEEDSVNPMGGGRGREFLTVSIAGGGESFEFAHADGVAAIVVEE